MFQRTFTVLSSESRARQKLAQSQQDRADEVLISVAILGLIAAISDGAPDSREIDAFTSDFRKRFVLSRRVAFRLITIALRRIRAPLQLVSLEQAFDTLNEHLDSEQKRVVFDGLTGVLLADKRIHEGEALFLDYVATKLHLVKALESDLDALIAERVGSDLPQKDAANKNRKVLEIEAICGRKVLEIEVN